VTRQFSGSQTTPCDRADLGSATGVRHGRRFALHPDDLVDRTQGRPLSEAGQLRVVDEADDDVAVGDEGELLVRGRYTFNGYLRAARDN